MEKHSKVSSKVYETESVSDEVIRTFIAQMEQTAPQQITDPKMLQPGQTLVNNLGESMTVITNDPATDDVTLAPSEEAQNVPEGVQTVKETDLTTQYTMDSQEY